MYDISEMTVNMATNFGFALNAMHDTKSIKFRLNFSGKKF